MLFPHRSTWLLCTVLAALTASAATPLAFAPPVSYPVGLNPMDVAIGDLNGDGHLDLVVANLDGQSISVLLGHGDGTFAQAVTYSTASASPTGIALGDFNGDGRLDVAVVSGNSPGSFPSVILFLGNGDGTLGTPTVTPTSNSPVSLAAADLNGDSKLDLVIGSNGGAGYMLGNGDGTFQAFQPLVQPPTITTIGEQYASVADLNGDGHPDIITANISDPPTVCVYLGNGTGTFTGPVIYNAAPAGAGPAVGVTAANLRGLGKLDLLVSTVHNFLDILPGNGDGTFQAFVEGFGGSAPNQIVAADFNGDGHLDIAVAASNSALACICTPDNFGITAYAGDGTGTFAAIAPLQQFAPGIQAAAIAVGDFNEDGRPDIVITDIGKNAVVVLLNSTATSSTVALTVSSAPTAGASITLQATVSANNAPATGTVNFLDGSTTLGTTTLSNGTAVFTLASLSAGAHSFSATYGGTSSVAPGASAPVVVSVPQDFSLSFPGSAVVTAGGTANVTISITPQPGGFTTPIQFSCSGLPALANCSFSPSSVTPGGSTATTTVSIATIATVASLHSPQWLWQLYAALVPVFGFVLLSGAGRQNARTFAVVLVLCLAGLASSCGGNSAAASSTKAASSPGTPAGTYSVTVSAQGGSTTHTAILTLTVR